jgi:hypothetical protein
MSRLTDNDKNWGPFTFARWRDRFSFALETEDEYYGPTARWSLLAVALGFALRARLPKWLPSPGSGRDYGFALTKNGDGEWNFLSLYYGAQTHDSSTEKRWSMFLPWSEWDHVRFSLYNPDGSHFYTEPKKEEFSVRMKKEEECPKVHFGFRDYDGELIVATCHIEEREWHRGRGSFKWLKWFTRPIIRRSLSLKFSEEVGREKGSWKGGTTGHGIDMLSVETPRQAFERYCKKDHRSKSGTYRITFVGPCSAPITKIATQ